MRELLLIAWLSVVVSGIAQAAVQVEHVSVLQRPGTKIVEIQYDVFSTVTNEVTISIVASNGVTAIPLISLTGAVGAGVSTGVARVAVWDMGADWNGNVAQGVAFDVYADEGTSTPSIPVGMVRIPAGINAGTVSYADGTEHVYTITIPSDFYMDECEVSLALWNTVYAWAVANGYVFDHAGSGRDLTHPVHTVSWFDVVKWCNARSEMEGRIPCYHSYDSSVYRAGALLFMPTCNTANDGYRLPTHDEWEYAARGGLANQYFPWGSTISHSLANYWSDPDPWYDYDVSPTPFFHPTFDTDPQPYTSPTGYFAPNGYGLYDMCGNVSEWIYLPEMDNEYTYMADEWAMGGMYATAASGSTCESSSSRPPSDISNGLGFRTVCQ